MINIDNLVRSRLGGAEEEERPGSWSSMRELLDKEMPQQPAAAFNWRRMLGYATALVVATSVSFGGYKMLSSDTPAGNMVNTVDNGNTPGNIKSLTKTTTVAGGEGARSTNNTNTTKENIAAVAAVNDIDNQGAGTNHSNPNKSPKHNSTPIAATTSQNTAQEAIISENAVDKNANEPANMKAGELVVSSGNTSDATAPGKAIPTNNAGDQPGPANPLFNSNTRKNSNATKSQKQTKPVACAKSGRNSTKPVAASNHASTGMAVSAAILPASASSTQLGMPAARPVGLTNTAKRLKADSILQIEVRYSRVYNPLTQRMTIRKDTLNYRKIQVLREEPTEELTALNQQKLPENNTAANKPATRSENKTANTEEQQDAPQAALKTAKDVDNNNNLVSLSKYRVDSKFNNIWDANARRFSAFVQNVHIALDRARFYGGITGGFNTTVFSNNSLAGFQLGFNGLLTFNEHWSVAADLKYFHRFNSVSINDNYTKVSNIVAGSESVVNGVTYREYTWNEDKVDHSFNLTAVQTIEMPVTLRYNMGRVFGEIGLNTMYSFAINAEEIERANNKPTSVTKTFPNTTSPMENTGSKPQVSLSDFNSRFGLGYVLGAGYQVTPALSANFRIVQNVWDNIGSDGGRKVSRNLYQTPSVQVSLGYRFGKKH